MNNISERLTFEPQRRFPFPVDDLVLSVFKECTPRILVFTDGLSFDSGDFGLDDFVNTLKSSTIHGMTPIVKTAHSGGPATGVDYDNFTFSPATLSKNKYDVLFLFGVNSGPGFLNAAEISTISAFMDDGSGVFATGDHANLGLKLCGDIPRVKGMRLWAGPSAGGVDRISTNDPGPSNDFQFDDQSDSIPQKIYPAYYGSQASSAPHALLQHPTKKVIEVLPDHPHESECVIPANLNDVSEWPKDTLGNDVEPEIVALSMSYGGGFSGKEPISAPKSFGAICAYNGHNANVGRISVDATWHHFININLVATAAGPGLQANADAYDRVNTYFENIASWLMPKKVRRCLRWPYIFTLKKLYPIAEFIPLLEDNPPNLAGLIELGSEAQKTLARFSTPGQQREFVDDLFDLHSEGLRQQIDLLRVPATSLEGVVGQKTAPIDLLEKVALGALITTAVKALPANGDLESDLKAVGGGEGLDKLAKASLSSALREFSDTIRKGRSHFDMVLECC